MYESLLKFATDDPYFSFKVKSVPYPPTNYIKIRLTRTNVGVIIFLTAITYSMMITSVVSYLVVERVSGLKHLQIISGMQILAYWVANFIFDFLKM